MMDCGMRPEEAMRIRKEHIFWGRSVILVPSGKSFKSKRYVPLSERIRKLLSLRNPVTARGYFHRSGRVADT
jgi:integrase